jgi:hypothetical protein
VLGRRCPQATIKQLDCCEYDGVPVISTTIKQVDCGGSISGLGARGFGGGPVDFWARVCAAPGDFGAWRALRARARNRLYGATGKECARGAVAGLPGTRVATR